MNGLTDAVVSTETMKQTPPQNDDCVNRMKRLLEKEETDVDSGAVKKIKLDNGCCAGDKISLLCSHEEAAPSPPASAVPSDGCEPATTISNGVTGSHRDLSNNNNDLSGAAPGLATSCCSSFPMELHGEKPVTASFIAGLTSCTVNGFDSTQAVSEDGGAEEEGPIDLSSCGDKRDKQDKQDSAVGTKNDGRNSSANESKLPNGALCVQKSLAEQKAMVRQLQSELRNEEAKLLLLKKLKHNQTQPRAAGIEALSHRTDVASSRSPVAIGTATKATSLPSGKTINGGAVQPPPLVRGSSAAVQPAVAVATQKPSHASPLIQHSSSQHAPFKSSQALSAPPPLVHMAGHRVPPSSSPQVPSSLASSARHLGSNNLGATTLAASQPLSHALPPIVQSSVPQQNAEQRQQAAKLALRKQLEKTLLQIAPPRPPPPEMNFVPNLISSEFIYLLGLEEIVKCLLGNGGDKKESRCNFNPFVCVQCETDYTPVWKRDRPGSSSVICEKCMTTNQKRVLKQEHTGRLKNAFVRALQREQELEQRLALPVEAASSNMATLPRAKADSNTSALAASTSHASAAAKWRQQQQRVHHQQHHHSHPLQHRSHHQQPHQQHSPIIEQHTAQLRAAAAMRTQAAALSYRQMYGSGGSLSTSAKPSAAAADMHRQYLLDMINPRLSWKT